MTPPMARRTSRWGIDRYAGPPPLYDRYPKSHWPDRPARYPQCHARIPCRLAIRACDAHRRQAPDRSVHWSLDQVWLNSPPTAISINDTVQLPPIKSSVPFAMPSLMTDKLTGSRTIKLSSFMRGELAASIRIHPSHWHAKDRARLWCSRRLAGQDHVHFRQLSNVVGVF